MIVVSSSSSSSSSGSSSNGWDFITPILCNDTDELIIPPPQNFDVMANTINYTQNSGFPNVIS